MRKGHSENLGKRDFFLLENTFVRWKIITREEILSKENILKEKNIDKG